MLKMCERGVKVFESSKMIDFIGLFDCVKDVKGNFARMRTHAWGFKKIFVSRARIEKTSSHPSQPVFYIYFQQLIRKIIFNIPFTGPSHPSQP